MHRRNVTTAFLTHPDQGVLLFHRSHHVNSFRGHWAGVSGSIEAGETPRQCALREIQEETSLSHPRDYRLIRHGRPLSVASPSAHTTFVVYPFLAALRRLQHQGSPHRNVTIDWEHDDVQWFPFSWPRHPNEPSLTVPQLRETWARVYIDDDALAADMDAIKNNTTDGAAQLAVDALRALEEHLIRRGEDKNDFETEEVMEHVKNVAFHLMHLRPNMVAIANGVAKAVSHGMEAVDHQCQRRRSLNIDPVEEKEHEKHISLGKHSLSLIADACHQQRDLIAVHARQSITAAMDNIIGSGDTILSLSSSSTVSHVLQTIAHPSRSDKSDGTMQRDRGKQITVVMAESRPQREGRSALMEMAMTSSDNTDRKHVGIECRSGIRGVLITDGGIYSAMERYPIQSCVVGADSIRYDGSFVNKTGTALLCLAARERGIPVYVLSDTGKISLNTDMKHGARDDDHDNNNNNNDNDEEGFEQGPASDLMDGQETANIGSRSLKGEEAIKVFNPVFEVIPPMPETVKFVTEKGILTVSDIVKEAKEIKKYHDNIMK